MKILKTINKALLVPAHLQVSLTRKHPATIHVGSRRQRYFNNGKELPLTVRIYDRVTWEYGGGGKFPFIVCQETGGIASAFYRALFQEKG
jgi:hypothetical protein